MIDIILYAIMFTAIFFLGVVIGHYYGWKSTNSMWEKDFNKLIDNERKARGIHYDKKNN